ncbi:hypothetical protein Z043_123111 [Scleropages formosus]|uniref:Leucine-rich repeat-containing protein 3 n=1 Tax=Scleropages formosus TaxID=113540 RepID=A0A0P7UDZ4_SCLFO|nr:hypothetical protein Z043_123111 [Scleropages formosus]
MVSGGWSEAGSNTATLMGRPAAVRTLTKVVFVGAALTAALVSDCPESCRCTERDGLTVQCVSRDLEVIPGDLPRNTVTLLLASNRISHVPRGSFRELPQLQELDLSRNAIETLDAGLPRNALSQLRARVRLSHNPWHCECSLQEALRELRLEPDTVGEVRCFTAVREEFRGRSIIQVLDSGIDFCSFRHKTMDVAMFVTMFAWFAMVIAYVVCYVRHNREEVHRHLEYLRSPPGSSHSSKDFESVNTGL